MRPAVVQHLLVANYSTSYNATFSGPCTLAVMLVLSLQKAMIV